MRTRILLVLLSCCLTGNSLAGEDSNFTLYLVRHAEKQSDGSRDPDLTESGNRRAAQLASHLQDWKIQDIWSSDYKRTRNTAKPLAGQLEVQIEIYDAGNLPGLATQLLEQRNNALVVGHSNTTPELARLLCKCSIANMDKSEYDRLIVITADGNQTRAETLDQGELFIRNKP